MLSDQLTDMRSRAYSILCQLSEKRHNLTIEVEVFSFSAAEKTRRKCYGLEIDPAYCQVIVQRWRDFTGQDKIKINGKEVLWSKYDV